MLRRFQFTAVLGVLAVAAAGLTHSWSRAFAEDAASYPDRPIRVIVSVPAGGGVDTVTRIVTDKMRVPLGQPLIVENKAGVGGVGRSRNGVQSRSGRLHAVGLAAVADHDQSGPL